MIDHMAEEILKQMQDRFGHICGCQVCNRALAEILPDDEHSFVVWREGQHDMKVFRGSLAEDISASVYQVIAGRVGKAWRYRDPMHHCGMCGTGICAYIDVADFSVAVEIPSHREGNPPK